MAGACWHSLNVSCQLQYYVLNVHTGAEKELFDLHLDILIAYVGKHTIMFIHQIQRNQNTYNVQEKVVCSKMIRWYLFAKCYMAHSTPQVRRGHRKVSTRHFF